MNLVCLIESRNIVNKFVQKISLNSKCRIYSIMKFSRYQQLTCNWKIFWMQSARNKWEKRILWNVFLFLVFSNYWYLLSFWFMNRNIKKHVATFLPLFFYALFRSDILNLFSGAGFRMGVQAPLPSMRWGLLSIPTSEMVGLLCPLSA